MLPMSARLWATGATLAAPFLRGYLLRRARLGKEDRARLPERWAEESAPRPAGVLLWLHAASIGETVSVLPVVSAIAGQNSEASVLFTTSTRTSAELLQRRIVELGLARRLFHRFVPLDVPAWAERFLAHWQPDLACFVESELWPNLVFACRRRGIPLVLLNARLSLGSFARWQRAPKLAHAMLSAFAEIQARTEADAARFAKLGARNVTARGDLKFAAPPLPVDDAELARLRAHLGGRPCWLAASIHPGEDAAVLAAHRALAARISGLLSIIVPRHPERGQAFAAAAKDLPLARRSAGEDPPSGGVYIADTLGELGLFYRLAGLAFIGGSLVPHGGQNPLEGARLGCALAVGPYTQNFEDAVAVLSQAGAIARLSDADALILWLERMFANPAARIKMAQAAEKAATRWVDLPQESAAMLLRLAQGAPKTRQS
jgi:3-deoxy-D-manno-octulosonic-acid transferase